MGSGVLAPRWAQPSSQPLGVLWAGARSTWTEPPGPRRGGAARAGPVSSPNCIVVLGPGAPLANQYVMLAGSDSARGPSGDPGANLRGLRGDNYSRAPASRSFSLGPAPQPQCLSQSPLALRLLCGPRLPLRVCPSCNG